MPERVKRGMVFGVFDGLHEGHRYLLNEAKSRAEELVVVVARDESAFRMKGKRPKRSLEARIDAVRSLNPRFRVIPGDEREGEWKVLAENAPDVVFLGYDQEPLARELALLKVQVVSLGAYRPEVFKSGLLDR